MTTTVSGSLSRKQLTSVFSKVGVHRASELADSHAFLFFVRSYCLPLGYLSGRLLQMMPRNSYSEQAESHVRATLPYEVALCTENTQCTQLRGAIAPTQAQASFPPYPADATFCPASTRSSATHLPQGQAAKPPRGACGGTLRTAPAAHDLDAQARPLLPYRAPPPPLQHTRTQRHTLRPPPTRRFRPSPCQILIRGTPFFVSPPRSPAQARDTPRQLAAVQGENGLMHAEPCRPGSDREFASEFARIASNLAGTREWDVRMAALAQVEGLVLGCGLRFLSQCCLLFSAACYCCCCC